MKNRQIFIITGEQGEGKTTKLKKVAAKLKAQNVPFTGFLAEGEWENGVRKTFTISDINTGEKKLLCTNEAGETLIPAGRFFFSPEALDFGKQVMRHPEKGLLVIVDEIGRFELDGKIWANAFQSLIKDLDNPVLFTVRKRFLDEVITHFGIEDPLIFNCNEEDYAIAQAIIKNIF